MPLYEEHETRISRQSLPSVLAEASEPACLLGGWAVYTTVNSRYRLANGHEYLGSRDIDIGFHFEGGEDANAVRRSALARTIRSLGRIGYEGAAFRMVKYYRKETRRPLTRDEASRVPLYDMFGMYVDLMVDNVPPGAKDALGFVPADEKMIGHALVRDMSDEIDGFGARILLPRPEVLLATKIASMPRRSEDHKRWKDIADMHALVWYAGVEIGDLLQSVTGLVPRPRLSTALGAITDQDCDQVARVLDADAGHVKATLAGFLGGGAEGGSGGGGGGPVGGGVKGGPWPTPYALGYEKFTAVVRALGEGAAGGRAAGTRGVAAAASVSEHNAAMNLSFLESIGVARAEGRGAYGLTAAGERYAGAHLSGQPDRIRAETRTVVEGSHLRRLADEARARPGMREGDLLLCIKEYGRRPDGPGAGNMQWPASTGARTLLRMLGDAGIMPGGEAPA